MPANSDRANHFDLLLEHQGTLLSWVTYSSLYSGLRTICYANREHRIDYLDFSGPLSNGRGVVNQVISGEIEWIAMAPEKVNALLKTEENHWSIELQKIDPDHPEVSANTNELEGAWMLCVTDADPSTQSG